MYSSRYEFHSLSYLSCFDKLGQRHDECSARRKRNYFLDTQLKRLKTGKPTVFQSFASKAAKVIVCPVCLLSGNLCVDCESLLPGTASRVRSMGGGLLPRGQCNGSSCCSTERGCAIRL